MWKIWFGIKVIIRNFEVFRYISCFFNSGVFPGLFSGFGVWIPLCTTHGIVFPHPLQPLFRKIFGVAHDIHVLSIAPKSSTNEGAVGPLVT